MYHLRDTRSLPGGRQGEVRKSRASLFPVIFLFLFFRRPRDCCCVFSCMSKELVSIETLPPAADVRDRRATLLPCWCLPPYDTSGIGVYRGHVGGGGGGDVVRERDRRGNRPRQPGPDHEPDQPADGREGAAVASQARGRGDPTIATTTTFLVLLLLHNGAMPALITARQSLCREMTGALFFRMNLLVFATLVQSVRVWLSITFRPPRKLHRRTPVCTHCCGGGSGERWAKISQKQEPRQHCRVGI